MSNADSKDGASSTAPTIRSTALADSGADTHVATEEETEAARRTSLVEEDGDELIGITLNERYQVTAKIGQGGMGAVYEARHTIIGKRVAIKVLLDKHAQKDQVVARLKQEARLASSIGHQNIIDITDFGSTETGRTFVVMEYLDGESLGACIHRVGRLEESRVIHICAQIASALTAAHDQGVIHRDIKPENIFLLKRGETDTIKVLDFGISKSLIPDEEEVRLTQTGMVLGTPLYMSPEQAAGDDLDHRVDIYALGVILYESITGEVPFKGKNYLNILTQVISDDPRQPSELRPSIDRNLESVILKAMAKDKDERYSTMQEMAEDLAALDSSDTQATSERITAARWRRNREKRPVRSYLAWVAGIAIVAGASVFAVDALLGDEQKAAIAPPLDAALPLVHARDAAPPKAAFMRASIVLESNPPGAAVFEGAREHCAATPCTITPPKTAKQLELRLELEGYQSNHFTVTPELDDGKTLPLRLQKVEPIKKSKRGRPKKTNNTKDKKSDKNDDDNTGDLNANPYRRKNN